MKFRTELYLLNACMLISFVTIITGLTYLLKELQNHNQQNVYAYNIRNAVSLQSNNLRTIIFNANEQAIENWLATDQQLAEIIDDHPPLSARQQILVKSIRQRHLAVSDLFAMLRKKTDFPHNRDRSELVLHLTNKLYAQMETIREDSLALTFQTSGSLETQINQQIRIIIIALVLVGSLLIFSSVRLSFKVNHRINLLIEGLRRLTQGDSSNRIKEVPNDEFAKLTTQFNEMLDHLQNNTISREKFNSILNLRTEKLRALSQTDALTGIPNRRAYEYRLNALVTSSRRSNSCLSLLMIDVDDFKAYNDARGHDQGDHILRTVAQILKQALPRDTDFVARFGGEEFIVILPSTDSAGARLIAERLRLAIEEKSLAHPASKCSSVVTISIGGSTRKGMEIHEQELLREADSSLYQAKENGRNCTVMYGESTRLSDSD